ncbi:MAG TPA: DJ-1 family glyoxalase III [Paludibacter sp.]|nr:DJ-1 family glyoxalase III [Paludibacter sp.]
MKVFVFLANGFEEIETIAPVDIFRRAGIDTLMVSVTGSKEVTGAHKIVVNADYLFDEVDFSGDNLLFLPGGMPGTSNLDAHKGLKELIGKHASEGKPLAAICAAPSILGKIGLLKGKEATCYPGYEKELKDAVLSGNKIAKSGQVMTAKAAGTAIPFALMIIEELLGKDTSDRIAQSICY